ncbi:MAG: cob(I)yrinic acid a,c-diamide adenosyltransferase [Negativicutes bacterium]|nr:cob(I)yrinic acid a,c-diamide adenosyltransferase [Negativicutes bacterium]
MAVAGVSTGRGDDGLTDLPGGRRVKKSDPRIEANGEIDELVATLGMVRAKLDDSHSRIEVLAIQHRLQEIMTMVAAGSVQWQDVPALEEIEHSLRVLAAGLPEQHRFIVPGDSEVAAMFDLARTVARRAERALWRLADTGPVARTAMVYLNRLSDWCFQQERLCLQQKQTGPSRRRRPRRRTENDTGR